MCIGHRSREGVVCVVQPGKCWVGALLQTRLSKASLFFNTQRGKSEQLESTKHAGVGAGRYANQAK